MVSGVHAVAANQQDVKFEKVAQVGGEDYSPFSVNSATGSGDTLLTRSIFAAAPAKLVAPMTEAQYLAWIDQQLAAGKIPSLDALVANFPPGMDPEPPNPGWILIEKVRQRMEYAADGNPTATLRAKQLELSMLVKKLEKNGDPSAELFQYILDGMLIDDPYHGEEIDIDCDCEHSEFAGSEYQRRVQEVTQKFQAAGDEKNISLLLGTLGNKSGEVVA